MNILKYFRKVYNPIAFQGENKKKKYFEGWYFKIVDKNEENVFAFIPGISLGKNQEENHSFLQILNGTDSSSEYIKFRTEDFLAQTDSFNVVVGKNCFCTTGMKIQTDNISGGIRLKNVYKWPVSFTSPGAMGWFSFFTFMQCYHGVFSMDHELSGQLNVNGKNIDFNGGRGYIEKDWGKEFPEKWIWMQSNHFDKGNVSLMLSVAKIPFLFTNFTGFICGLKIENDFYKFATYTGAKIIKIESSENYVEIIISQGKYLLEVKAKLLIAGNLISPMEGEMKGKVKESVKSKLKVKFYEKGKLIYYGEGRNAGLEIEWTKK